MSDWSLRCGSFGIIFLLLLLSTVSANTESSDVSRLIAIGDLHGDLDNARYLFEFANVTDSSGHWIAGQDIVIQLGDVSDRGPSAHTILDWFEILEMEARDAGGEFTFLIGNHEVLLMCDDHRFVNQDSVKAFGGSLEAYAAAFRVEGSYGKFVFSHPVTVARRGVVFVHAGIIPMFASLGIDGINKHFRDNYRLHNNKHSPVWSRDVLHAAQAGDCHPLEESLRLISEKEESAGRPSVHRMIVGHTIQKNGTMTLLCDGRLVAADIAVTSNIMGGGNIGFLEYVNISAEEIRGATPWWKRVLWNVNSQSSQVEPKPRYPPSPERRHLGPPLSRLVYPPRKEVTLSSGDTVPNKNALIIPKTFVAAFPSKLVGQSQRVKRRPLNITWYVDRNNVSYLRTLDWELKEYESNQRVMQPQRVTIMIPVFFCSALIAAVVVVVRLSIRRGRLWKTRPNVFWRFLAASFLRPYQRTWPLAGNIASHEV